MKIVFLFILDGIGFMKVNLFFINIVFHGNEWQSTTIESTIVG